jgi:hypothetical protein
VSAVSYKLGVYIQEDGIVHIHCRENLKYYPNKWVFASSDGVNPQKISGEVHLVNSRSQICTELFIVTVRCGPCGPIPDVLCLFNIILS